MESQRRRGQGAFEYILLLGAVILFILIALVVTKAKIFSPAVNTTQTNVGQYSGLSNAICNIAGQRCPAGYGCYFGNGTCLPNLIVTNPSFEDPLAPAWNPGLNADRNSTHHWDGSWSVQFFENNDPTIYATDFENMNGTYVVGAMAMSNNTDCVATVAVMNTSYLGGVCGAFDPGSVELSTTTATSWTPIYAPITLDQPSCLEVVVGVSGGTSCYSFIDAVYLIKVA